MKIQSYSDGNVRATVNSMRLHTVYSFSDKKQSILTNVFVLI